MNGVILSFGNEGVWWLHDTWWNMWTITLVRLKNIFKRIPKFFMAWKCISFACVYDWSCTSWLGCWGMVKELLDSAIINLTWHLNKSSITYLKTPIRPSPSLIIIYPFLFFTRLKKYQMVWTKSGHCETTGDFLSGWSTHPKEHGGMSQGRKWKAHGQC